MSKTIKKETSWEKRDQWPPLMCIKPRTVIISVALLLIVAWTIFLASDIYGWIDMGERPAWMLLFNDRPVEWAQYFLMAFAITGSGYLAGRLENKKEKKVARFFFIMALGFGLMMIEDTGDIRHELSREVERLFGSRIFGFRHNFIVEVPYFLTIASVPLYALIRYGKYVWKYTKTRYYLIAGFLLYGIAVGGSALSNIAHSYVGVGRFVDIVFFGERLKPLAGRSQEFTYFLFTDSAIEESIELLGVTMFVVSILVFAEVIRKRFNKTD